MISRRERRVSRSEYVFRLTAILSVLCVSYVPAMSPRIAANSWRDQVPSSIYLSPMENLSDFSDFLFTAAHMHYLKLSQLGRKRLSRRSRQHSS